MSSFSCDYRANEASFLTAWNIARAKRPYKRTMEEVVKVLDPYNIKLIKLIAQVSMSHRTTGYLGAVSVKNVENSLMCEFKNCTAFSLALDETADIHVVPQLTVFSRYVSVDVNVKEEILDLVVLIEITRGIDTLEEVMNRFELPGDKLDMEKLRLHWSFEIRS